MKWTLMAALFGSGLAQNEVVTEYASTVTVGYQLSSLPAVAFAINNAVSTSLQPTTLSTIILHPSSASAAVASPSAVLRDSQSNGTGAGGYDTAPVGTDTSGGASGGDSSSFSISQGGMIAIIVVCCFVVILGVATTVLYILAKRRQWDVRGSIARASRRLTGRFGGAKQPARPSRRQGMHAKDIPMTQTKPSHKRGLVVDVKPLPNPRDPLRGKAPANTRPREQTWVKGLWGGGWK